MSVDNCCWLLIAIGLELDRSGIDIVQFQFRDELPLDVRDLLLLDETFEVGDIMVASAQAMGGVKVMGWEWGGGSRDM